MENFFETICAVATPLSAGSIGVIRISGEKSFEINKELGKSAASSCDFAILVGEKQAEPIYAGLKEEKIIDIIKKNSKNKDAKIKDVLLLTVDQMGEAFLQMKKGEGITFTTQKLVQS